MLREFPYSFAPANASALAKNDAHFVLSQTNDEGAVYEGLMILKDKKLL